MEPVRPRRLPEIDRAKGIAILFVVCIHAKLGDHTVFYHLVVDRAVPIFLVLFGLTSEAWWQSRVSAHEAPLVAWYRTRFSRLFPPVWAFAVLWWGMGVLLGRADPFRRFGDVLATCLGYCPWIGPTWFITLVFQLILIFPIVRFAVSKAGAVPSLFVAALLTAYCGWRVWDIDAWVRALVRGPAAFWYYQAIFPPRVAWQVVSGIVLCRFVHRLGVRTTIVAISLVALEPLAISLVRHPMEEMLVGPLRPQIVQALFDVPLAVAVIGTVKWLPSRSRAARALEWCGAATWPIYLGHVVFHEVMLMTGRSSAEGSFLMRGLYALFLLGAGVGAAVCAHAATGAVRLRAVQVRAVPGLSEPSLGD